MDSDDWFAVLSIVVIIAIVTLSIGRGVFVDEKIAVDTLYKQGFTDIKISGKTGF